MSSPQFEPRRFRSTVPYYARFRLAYPPELIGEVIKLVELARGDRMMDLGCGPGLLAIPFAQAGLAVTGVDPEPDMLEAAVAAAADAHVEIDFRHGSSFGLPADIGPLKLVAMGRSFHWMDRTETLKTLDRLVVPGGAVALFADDHPKTAENNWLDTLREVGERYGAQNAEHRIAARKSDYRSSVSHLFDSAFSRIQRVSVFVKREITADEVVGRALSLSMLSPEKLGERTAAFESELRAAMISLSSDRRFTEIAEISAIVARRS